MEAQKMKAALGIDFGTTNSTMCFYDGTGYHFANLEGDEHTIPSLMYVDKQYYPTYGELARSHFLKDNLHRRIKLEKTDLGYIQITLSEGAIALFEGDGIGAEGTGPQYTGYSSVPSTFDARISTFTDQHLPGFLFASTKRLLGQSAMNSVKLFDKNIKLEAVVSSIIQSIRSKYETEYSHLETVHACVGRPVNYECAAEHEQKVCNEHAIARMDKALTHAGILKFDYFYEPIAPVLAHIHEFDAETNQNILVLDFGGGTLDLSIIEKRDKRLQVVGNFGRALGGDIINEKLIRDHILTRMGLSQNNLIELKRRNNSLGDIIPDILNWRTTYMMNQPKYLMLIAEATRLLPREAENLNRIRLLITQNYSYNVFYAVETAKKRLSNSLETKVELPQIGISFTLSRRELEKSMIDYLASMELSIMSFFAENRYQTGQIGRVLLTGGTSLIPSINQRIRSLFSGDVVEIDPFLSAVKGFALGAWLHSRKKISLSGDQFHMK
jgi:hypothetical chaperone protein